MRIPLFAWLLMLCAAGSGCAKPSRGWPPSQAEVYAYTDILAAGIHTFAVLHPPPDGRPAYYREYGFAEKGWYLEGRQGSPGTLRSLFWPSESVIEMKQFDSDAFLTAYGPAVRTWRFALSREGYQAMEEFLQSWHVPQALIAGFEDAQYYEGRYPYHLFNGCHHYTAGALRAAGVPIRPSWALSRWLMAFQLDRAEALQEKKRAERI